MSPAAAMSRSAVRLLVVDDNATNRRVLVSTLTAAGFDVRESWSGPAALNLMQAARDAQEPITVVLTDQSMSPMDGAELGRLIKGNPDLSSAHLVMLTSVDQQRASDLEAIGFSSYLVKPVRSHELLQCVERVLAPEQNTSTTASQRIVTREVLTAESSAVRYSGKVLLAEDNVVNQKVAKRFLEKLGCQVTVAADGLEAIEIFQRELFDLIFMDVQMPKMDGYEATRSIRKMQGEGKRIPIIALTANAMSDQVNLCMASGMDEFLSKPLDSAKLREMLHRFLLPRASTDPGGLPAYKAM